MNAWRCTLAVMTLLVLAKAAPAQHRSSPTRCPDVAALRRAAPRTTPRTADSLASNRLVADGRAASRTLSGANVTTAISLFEHAVRTDPGNASAYIALARAHTQSQRYLSVPKQEAQARARETLSRGRALEPANIDGLHLLADVVLANQHDYACARTILEGALALDPKNPLSSHYLSQLLSGMGEFDRAFRYADSALVHAGAETRPFILRNLGRPRYMAGAYDWVLTTYLASDPDAPLAHFYRSLAHGAKGEFAAALEEARAYRARDPARDAGGIGMIALAYANAGHRDTAQALLHELLQRDARGEHVVEYRIAAVYAALGQRNMAFRWLGREIEDTDGLGSWLLWLNHDPVWKEMRNDRRWSSIRKRAGW